MIWLDMDGTIANLYGNKNWLEELRAYSVAPYRNAKPMVNELQLEELLAAGYGLGIISWCAGYHNNKEYDKQVRQAKREWLKENYPNIKFEHIHIVKFGTPKEKFYNIGDMLIDDEELNRKNWKGQAYHPNDFFFN